MKIVIGWTTLILGGVLVLVLFLGVGESDFLMNLVKVIAASALFLGGTLAVLLLEIRDAVQELKSAIAEI